MRDTEADFYARLKQKCKGTIHMIRVENALGSGFPDVVMCYKTWERMCEIKAEYEGGWFYVRNTQIAFCTQVLNYGVDVPFIIADLKGGFWILRFSELMFLPHVEWKQNYKKFNTQAIMRGVDGPRYVSKHDSFPDALITHLFTS